MQGKLLGFAFRIKEMEEKQSNNAFSSLMQFVILGILPFVLFDLYDPQAIHESTMPLDCLLCNWFSRLIKLKLYLCSNSVFLILLSNAIICCLLVSSGLLSTPREARDLCKANAMKGENLRGQIAAKSCCIEKKCSLDNESIRKGGNKSMLAENGRACEIYFTENFEEEAKWDEMGAVVPYQSILADNDEEELKRRCDEFIANFRRQMTLQSGYS